MKVQERKKQGYERNDTAKRSMFVYGQLLSRFRTLYTNEPRYQLTITALSSGTSVEIYEALRNICGLGGYLLLPVNQ